VALLSNPANQANARQIRDAQGAARQLGVQLQPLAVRSSAEIDGAFAAIAAERAGAIIVFADAVLLDHRRRIAELAARHRLPMVSERVENVEVGGLMAYGPSIAERFRRAATYVDKILKGAKPADLPIERPTTFELAINLKTAKALGLTIPPSVLGRADHVIE
jgi:putative ABC transport system substrate-binding protein